MNSCLSQSLIRWTHAIIIIGALLLCANVVAAPDNGGALKLSDNESPDIVDIQETVAVPSATMTEIVTPEDPTNEPADPAVNETTPGTQITELTPVATGTTGVSETGSPEVTITPPAPVSVQSPVSKNYVSNEVIVRYNYKKISSQGISAVSAKKNAEMGAAVLKDFSSKGLPGMQVVRIPVNISVEDAIAQYENDPDVLYAEPNYIVRIASTVPSDTSFVLQWGLNNNGQLIDNVQGTVDADIDAPEAWDLTGGKHSVVVAVVDTGVDYNHPDLAANIWNNTDEIPGNGLDDDSNGYIDDVNGWNFFNENNESMDVNSLDDLYHGTHCAGTIGAVGNNGEGISGVNWNVSIMPLRFLDETGSGSIVNATEAILYANANGADIISNSWGGSSDSATLKAAIDASSAVVVCAAGNYGSDVEEYPFYPASFTSPNIISVAATNNTDQLADFSNYGSTSVDLAAPGVSIFSTKKSSSYQNMSGTSMATPFVSGVAAMIKAKNSSLTAAQIKSAILNNVDVKGSLSGKVATGGRLNAFAALVSVSGGDQIARFRPSTGSWYFDTNLNGATEKSFAWGKNGDSPLTGDFNGNGVTDIGIFRPSTSYWYFDTNLNGASDKSFAWGRSGDTPVTGDFNGDETTEIGIFRPSTGYWYFDTNLNGASDKSFAWGRSGDTPVTGDFNGDETTDIGIFRPSTGFWYFDTNLNGASDTSFSWGRSGDTLITGDFNGDGTDDIGIFRSSTRFWYFDTNLNGASDKSFTWGMSGDLTVTGDFNGDGTTDIGIFRPSTGSWYFDTNLNGGTDFSLTWGLIGDTPLAGDFSP